MAARVLDCPQCGAPVNFRSSIAVFAVCEHCHSMIVLRGVDAELLGLMAALPPDLSPFQIGTRGEWQGQSFEIVGRIRVEWEQGSWNEWCLVYDGNKTAWLAEAQGLLMVSVAVEVKEQIPSDPDIYQFQKHLQLNGASWTASDVKTVTYRASEGELPFTALPQQTEVSVDFIGAERGFANIEYAPDGPEVFLGEYVTFDALKFTNLRPVPGWNSEVAQEKNRTTALSCLSCGAPVELRAVGQSMSAVCASCGSVIDTATPEFKLIEKADAAYRALAPLLPIGQRGQLFGTEYEVIGLMARKDQWSSWSEYLLFNPWQGFRWLVFFQGHWSFVERLPAVPNLRGRAVKLDGRNYKLFAENKATVTNVLGEFYWQVHRGERAEVSDYIAPPFVLSKEMYPDLIEVAWSRGEYVEPRVIAHAFKVDKLPRTKGPYLNRPNKFAQRWREIRILVFVVVAALLGIQAISIAHLPETPVVEGSYVFERAPSPFVMPSSPFAAVEPQKIFSTERFQLGGGEQRVVIEATAPVDNNWLDLDFNLVNAQTNESFPASVEVSLYRGYDSDGAWSEGGLTAQTALAAVPPGTYFLTIEPSAEANITRMRFDVRVRSGGTFNSNLLIMLALVLVYPAVLLFRRSRFEAARWEESDFSP